MGQQVQINKQGISSKISHEGGRGGSLASTAKWAHVIVLIVTSSWNFWLYLLISSVWDVWVFVFHSRDRKVEGTYTRCLFGGTFMVGGPTLSVLIFPGINSRGNKILRELIFANCQKCK